MSILPLCPLFQLAHFSFLLVRCKIPLHALERGAHICKYFLPFGGWSSHSLLGSLEHKGLHVDEVCLFAVGGALAAPATKPLSDLRSPRFTLTFKSILMLGLPFRPSTHFALIFVYSMRLGSSCILLPVAN